MKVHKSGGSKTWQSTRCGIDAKKLPFFDKDPWRQLKEFERVGAAMEQSPDAKCFQWYPVNCPDCLKFRGHK